MKASDLELRRIPVEQLAERESNPNQHAASQIEQIRQSIAEFGFVLPLLVEPDGDDRYTLVAGHGTLQAAVAEGYTELDCILCSHLSPAQIEGLQVALNQLPRHATWDPDKLRSSIDAATAGGVELAAVGFEQTELNALLASLEGTSGTSGASGSERKSCETIRIEVPFDVLDQVLDDIGSAIEHYDGVAIL